MKLIEAYQKRILISPLNWGMGHVSRCIGLIYQLKKQENEIIIACSQDQQKVFEEYFEDVEFISHEGYPFRFGGKGYFSWDLLKDSIRLNKRRKQEEIEVEGYVKKHNIDLVISDHRYGFRSYNVPSAFVTHQLNLPVLWFEIAVQKIHIQLIKKFSSVWVMDFQDSRLAGELSRNKYALSVDFIGPFSRFMIYPNVEEKSGDTVLVISGPKEYQQQLIDLSCFKGALQLIGGNEKNVKQNMLISPVSWKEQDQLILNAPLLISRSGYSTIMDLYFLNTKSQLIPTPGQREQEYLSECINK